MGIDSLVSSAFVISNLLTRPWLHIPVYQPNLMINFYYMFVQDGQRVEGGR